MKLLIVISLVGLSAISEAGCKSRASKNMAAAWKRYSVSGKASDATELMRFLPKNKLAKDECPGWTEINTKLSTDMKKLEEQVGKVDPTSVELAFRMYLLTDGAVAEAFDEMLGKLSTAAPELFLTEMGKLPIRLQCNGGILKNLGDYGTMSESDQKDVLKKRREALSKVESKDLEKIKLACLKKLESD